MLLFKSLSSMVKTRRVWISNAAVDDVAQKVSYQGGQPIVGVEPIYMGGHKELTSARVYAALLCVERTRKS